MPITKEKKGAILDGLKAQMKDAKAVVFADYKGLSVLELSQLRSALREKGVEFKVAKKTLLRLAAKEQGFEDIPDEVLEGPVGAAFSMEDEISAAKTLATFAKKHKNLELRGALFEGRILSVEETKQLAALPGKEELLAKFIFVIKSPISGFHGVLNNTVSGFVRVLNAIKEKQEQAV